MALPTKATISTLSYSGDGSPWCIVGTTSTVDLDTLVYSTHGYPTWGIEDITAVLPIKKVSDSLWTGLKKIGGIIIANIKKIGDRLAI